MIVFISSVRRGLEAERDYLPGLLRATGYEPRRFEDFTAQPVPSRDACLAGVESADVYLLLLGEHYGEPLPDSGRAPTEEEFTVARRRGIPVLVFRKKCVSPDGRQDNFIAQVGDYQQGRFWKEFSDNGELAVVVLEALKHVTAKATPLNWELVLAQPTVHWRVDRPVFEDRSGGYMPMLEAHLVAPSAKPLLTVSALEPLANRLGRAGRDSGLFPETARVGLGSDANVVWASCAGDEASPEGWTEGQRGGRSGAALDRFGSVLVFKALPRDTLGTLVNQSYLTEQLKPLLLLGNQLLPTGLGKTVPVAGLEPINDVMEGDAAEVGHRTRGSLRTIQNEPVRTMPEAQVAAAALPDAVPEIARELAARLIAELRTRKW